MKILESPQERGQRQKERKAGTAGASNDSPESLLTVPPHCEADYTRVHSFSKVSVSAENVAPTVR